MIDAKRTDEKFNLRNVKDEEIFSAIKNDVVNVIKTFKGYENIESKDVSLNTEYTDRHDFFADDYNLYPKITLDVSVKSDLTYDSFNIFIDPFNIKVAPRKYNPQLVEDQKLTNAFIKFMLLKFPGANYTEKREEYLIKSQNSKKVRDDLLFRK